MNATIYVAIGGILLSGLNIVMLFNAARKFGRLEMMVETMWESFRAGRFVQSPDGIAHDAPGDGERPQ